MDDQGLRQTQVLIDSYVREGLTAPDNQNRFVFRSMMSRVDTNLQEWDDEALVRQAIRRGSSDDRPFTELFRRHKQLVWWVCYRFTSDASDAEDLMQEIFTKAYRHLNTFKGQAQFRTWLYQIALNTCRNELRYRKRRPDAIDAHVDDLVLVDADTRARDPHDQSFTNVATALTRLRPEDQELLLMRDVEGLPHTEIAALLGIQLSATKMRIQRARLALRAELNAQELNEERG